MSPKVDSCPVLPSWCSQIPRLRSPFSDRAEQHRTGGRVECQNGVRIPESLPPGPAVLVGSFHKQGVVACNRDAGPTAWLKTSVHTS